MDWKSIQKTYARGVMRGLRLKGFADSVLTEALGVGPVRLARLFKGEFSITERLTKRIESLTGMTTGQLAALYADPHRKGLAQLMDELAENRLARSVLDRRGARSASHRVKSLASSRPRAARRRTA